MDFNRLYFDHQLLLMRASRPGTDLARRTHEASARTLAADIAAFQRRLGAGSALAWAALSSPHECECAA